MNPTVNYDLTIIIPVYNEQDSFTALSDALLDYLSKATVKTCVLFVNDASTDHSLSLIRDFCMRERDVFYISLERRNGVVGAIKAALKLIQSPYTGYMDADLQTFPSDFEKLLGRRFDSGIVLGVRDFKHESFLYRTKKFLGYKLRNFVTRDYILDVTCPLKLGKTRLLQSLPWYDGMGNLMPALVQLTGHRVRTVEVRFQKRRFGKSKRNHIWETSRFFCNLLAFIWIKKSFLHPAVGENNLES